MSETPGNYFDFNTNSAMTATAGAKNKRRRSNYRAIAKLSQAVFLLSMGLAASVILNVVLILKGG